jgi:hypothetical protein
MEMDMLDVNLVSSIEKFRDEKMSVYSVNRQGLCTSLSIQ